MQVYIILIDKTVCKRN